MAGRFVYVACADPRSIAMFRMDKRTGALDAIGTTEVPGADEASPTMPLAVGPDRRVLHAALRVPPYVVSSFAIDPTDGTLRLLGGSTLPDSMAYIATDRTGTMLLSASYGGGVVAVSRIDARGVVRGPAAQVAATPPKAHCILADPANRFVYAACLGGDTVLCWGFDPATGLTRADAPHATPIRHGAGPRHLAFGPDATMLYVVNELDGTVDVFGRDPATGALSYRQTAAAFASAREGGGGAEAADLHLTPDGRFLYASIRANSTITGFAVNAGGTLTLIGRTDVEPTPRGFAIDADGRFLLSAGRTSACLGVYAIDGESGALSRIGRYEVGGNPNWVEIVDPG